MLTLRSYEKDFSDSLSMAYIENQIHAAAARNTELLQILGRTDYAKPSLLQQNNYISGLENSSATNRANLVQLEAKLATESKKNDSYKDSVMKKFAYRATGQKDKFEEHAAQEERDYLNALHAEQHAKEEGGQLARQLEDARGRKRELETVAGEHDRAKRELDSLYSSIFAGQTPAYPQEDQQENMVGFAWNEYQQVQCNVRAQQQVQQLLGNAQQAMTNAMASVDNALRAGRYDMYNRGGGYADVWKHNALNQAEVAVREAYRLNDQAMSMSDAVSRLPMVQIAHGNLMADIVFDNVWSDYAFQNKIRATEGDVMQASMALQQNQASVEQRCNAVRQAMAGASQRLEDARMRLQKVRESIFQQANGQVY